jgi:Flp pilus assembly protein TadG
MQETKKRQIPNRLGRRGSARCGSITVEMALVLPIFFTLLFACFEFSQANLMRHGAESAAYEAARAAIVPGATNQDVTRAAERTLASVGVTNFTISTTPSNIRTNTTELEVRVQIPLDQNMTFATFVRGVNFTGQCRLSRERQ